MRSNNINPAVVKVSFNSKKNVNKFRVLLGQIGYPSIDVNSCKIEAADSENDLFSL
jgi:hypothetical protein